MSVLTPNMGLVQSTVNVDTGLQWEENLNSSLSVIDTHSHSPGSGVPVTPSGLNINSDLEINNNNLTLIRSVNFQVQPTAIGNPADIGCLYVSGADLYFNDENGNQVRITSGGNVNATSSGISSGTATASFVASVLVVNAASNTPANIQGGSILLGNNSAGSKFLTLSPPGAMAANYTLTLPSVPASQKFMTLDSSGTMAAPWAVDNSTIEVSSNTVQVKDGGITPQKLSALGQQISTPLTSQIISSTSFVDVTSQSVSITTTGRPVFIAIVAGPDNTHGQSQFFMNASTAVCVTQYQLLRGATVVGIWAYSFNIGGGTSSTSAIPINLIQIDPVAAGTYTYKLQARVTAGTMSLSVSNIQTIAYEL